MQIADMLSPDRIQLNLACKSKKNALAISAKLIADADSSLAQTDIFDCLLARERLGGTGFGNGVAMPHGRLQYNQQTMASFITLNNGVDYDAIDGQPVDLVFALIVPQDSADEHLQILSMLASKFKDRDLINKIRRAASAQAIYKLLTAK